LVSAAVKLTVPPNGTTVAASVGPGHVDAQVRGETTVNEGRSSAARIVAAKLR
jgi:hypothetical protein